MRIAATIALTLALAAVPSTASAALQVSAPSLVPTMSQPGVVHYEVYAQAQGQYEHTRSEGAIVAKSASGGGIENGISFIRDYASKTKTLNLPNNPRRPSLTLSAGETYTVTIHWLAGGGGCGTCGETGDSPPTTIVVPPEDPKDRIDLNRKLDFSACAKRFEDAVIGNILPIMFSPTKGIRDYYFEKNSRDTAMARSCRQLAADPIDRRFRSRVKLRKIPASTFKPGSAGAAGAPLAAVLSVEGKLAVELEALTVSINRSQGAAKARKRSFEREQMLAAAGHARKASSLFRALAAALPKAAASLQQAFPEVVGQAVTDADLAAAHAQLAGGLPAGQVAALRRFGLTGAQLRDATVIFNNTDTLGGVTLGALMADPAVIAMLKAQAKALKGLAAAWRRNPTGEL